MSLENDLQKEQVIHLDVSRFTEVGAGTPVREVIEQMRGENNNCALVTDNGDLMGIFTDRDLLRKVVAFPETWDNPIDNVMTTAPITVKSNTPAYSALDLMDQERFRNVPVIDDQNQVIGNLTHYAIIKYLADRFPESVYNLPPVSDRVTKKRDGA